MKYRVMKFVSGSGKQRFQPQYKFLFWWRPLTDFTFPVWCDSVDDAIDEIHKRIPLKPEDVVYETKS